MTTLYLVQSDYVSCSAIFKQFSTMLNTQDSVLLLGESLFAWQDMMDQTIYYPYKIYALADDIQHLSQFATSYLAVEMDTVVDLILQHDRCVRL